jgi:hypothetical protein
MHMASNDNDDDFYNDPQTMGGDNSDLTEPSDLPENQRDDLSQTPYLPEHDKEDEDGRGVLDELEEPTDEPTDHEPDAEKFHPDNDSLGGVVPNDERDGNDPV